MSDFPEKIWVTHKEEFPGHVSFRASNLDHSNSTDGTYPEYIRADLVPQWQPIETLTTSERVIVLFDNDHIDSGWLDNIDERRFFRTGHGKLPLTRLTHWMPIQKVPE